MGATVRFDRLDARHSDALGDSLRCLVIDVDDGDDPRHAEMFEASREAGFCRLGCITLTPRVASERVTEFDLAG
jgi:hypothetical protein